jgi:hypothetical protein
MPGDILTITISGFFIVVLLIWASDARLTPIEMKRILKEIKVGLKINSRSIVVFFASTIFWILAIRTIFTQQGDGNLIYTDVEQYFYLVLLPICSTGFLMGLALAENEKDRTIDIFCRIDIARCLLRINRKTEARMQLEILWEEIQRENHPPEMISLVYASLAVITKSPDEVNKALGEVVESLAEDNRYRELYQNSIEKTRYLISESNVSPLS